MKYWKRWIADIQAKTSALTLIERGAYTELLDHYYMENGPISGDHSMLYRICRAFEKHEREAIDRVLGSYFHKTDAGMYMNRRAQEEIERADKYSEEQRERSALGVAARRGESPLQPQERAPRKPAHKLNGAFVEFWTAYPRKVAKGAAEKAWLRVKADPDLEQRIIAAVQVHAKSEQWQRDEGAFIPHPATWLNQRRWEDAAHVDAPQINARCHYCPRPAVKITNGIPHCGEARHLDFAERGDK